MAGKDVAKAKETSLTAGGHDYGELAGVGFEDTKGSDLSIPFINLLQSNSPVIQDDLIPGAKIGDMLNTVTGQLTKGAEGIVFQPVHKEEAWVEWVPRIKGGGFVGLHDPSGDVVQKLIRDNGNSRIPPKGSDGKRIAFKHNGNEVIETYYVYGLLLNKEGTEVDSFAVISFSSTKIKPYRDMLTSMYLIKGKPPMLANRALIKSVKQTNEAGTFANFSIGPLKETWSASLIDPKEEADLIQAGIDFREMVTSGVARADFTNQDEATIVAGADVDSDKAPF